MQGEQASQKPTKARTTTSDTDPPPAAGPTFDVYFINEEMKDVLKAVNDEKNFFDEGATPTEEEEKEALQR